MEISMCFMAADTEALAAVSHYHERHLETHTETFTKRTGLWLILDVFKEQSSNSSKAAALGS